MKKQNKTMPVYDIDTIEKLRAQYARQNNLEHYYKQRNIEKVEERGNMQFFVICIVVALLLTLILIS